MSDLFTALHAAVSSYVLTVPALMERLGEPVALSPLAAGEYNLNYVATGARGSAVVRVNTGSQEIAAGEQQILYEATALRALAPTGLAPALYHVDATPAGVGHGLLVEEYLPGRPLDYGREVDLIGAAGTLARLHAFVPSGEARAAFLELAHPLSQYLAFGRDMLRVYRQWAGADRTVLAVLETVEVALARLAPDEVDLFPKALRGVVHTDVQAHNFIVNDAAATVRLVDWEKPMIDDPSYDLAHFLAVTSTLWKCDVTLDACQRQVFLEHYRDTLATLRPGAEARLDERLASRQPFLHWRAICWCAMAHVEYQTPGRLLRNAGTAARIQQYLRAPFLASLFAPVL